MYRRKLNKWGFEKRVKVSEAEFITRRWIERGAHGKDSEFILRGRQVHWEVSFRATKSVQEIMSSESYGAATPPHLRCSTPDPATSSAKWSAEFLQKYAKEVEAYKERSSGIGNSTTESQSQDNPSPKATASNRDSPEREHQALS